MFKKQQPELDIAAIAEKSEIALDALEVNSSRVHETMNRLSEFIESVDGRLAQIKGKVTVSVSDGSGFSLVFGRIGKWWGLIACTTGSRGVGGYRNPLVNGPLEYKVRAAPLIPALLEKLLEEQEKIVEQINEVLPS